MVWESKGLLVVQLRVGQVGAGTSNGIGLGVHLLVNCTNLMPNLDAVHSLVDAPPFPPFMNFMHLMHNMDVLDEPDAQHGCTG
jgi:hypothetical protein